MLHKTAALTAPSTLTVGVKGDSFASKICHEDNQTLWDKDLGTPPRCQNRPVSTDRDKLARHNTRHSQYSPYWALHVTGRARRSWWHSRGFLGVCAFYADQTEALEAFPEGAVRQAVDEAVAETVADR